MATEKANWFLQQLELGLISYDEPSTVTRSFYLSPALQNGPVNMISAANQRPILLFDGVCNLCTGSVRFVIQRDPEKQFRFASLQSSVAKELLGANATEPADVLGSIVLIDDDGIWLRSTAALRVAGQLSGIWPLMQMLLIVPRPLRDWVYDFVGVRRYRWFGRTEACWVPEQDISDRFLDGCAQSKR